MKELKQGNEGTVERKGAKKGSKFVSKMGGKNGRNRGKVTF